MTFEDIVTFEEFKHIPINWCKVIAVGRAPDRHWLGANYIHNVYVHTKTKKYEIVCDSIAEKKKAFNIIVNTLRKKGILLKPSRWNTLRSDSGRYWYYLENTRYKK